MAVIEQYWVYLVPLLLIQVTLQTLATINLVRAEKVMGGNKIVWGVIIWLFQIIGPLIYFSVGRKA